MKAVASIQLILSDEHYSLVFKLFAKISNNLYISLSIAQRISKQNI